MFKFELNADLREVWLRLAGEFNAGVAESHRAPFVREKTGVKIPPPAPDWEE